MEGRGLLRGAALLVFLALARVVISGSLQSPLVSDPAPDALPELLDRAEEARRLDSIRTLPLGEGERMDPNRSSVDELDRLPGVGPRVAAAIVQFRESSGGFSGVEDLLQVPGIGPTTLERIRPHLDLSEGRRVSRLRPSSAVELLDLNRATREELQALPGIGPALSDRIVESRSKDGPFKTIEDLLRVSGIGPVTLSRIKPLIQVRRIS